MPRTRVIFDIVSEDEMNDRQQRQLAEAASEFGRVIGTDGMEINVDPNEDHAWGHSHVSTEDQACRFCRHAAADELN